MAGKIYFGKGTKFWMAFKKIFQGQRLNKFTAAVGRKLFGGKKKFWIEQLCIENSIIIYSFRFKVRLAFSVKVAMFVPKKWLNIRISLALFAQLLRQSRDHKSTHTYITLILFIEI